MNIKIGTLVWISWNILIVAYTSSVPRSDYGELKLFGAPASYAVDTTVLLNDASRRDKEVGYKIRATLELVPAWSDDFSEFLFKFNLLSPQLHSRSTHISADFIPQKSVWDKHAQSTFYAHWKNGLIQASYLDDSEPVEIINYKKSLISLFQFQVIDGENNETDISGTCRVLYETLSMQNIRKIKSGCESGEAGMPGTAASGEGMESRRLNSYTLSAALDALDELYAEELHTAGDAAASFALRARAWQRLTRAPAASAAPAAPGAPAASLAAALAALPAALTPHSLQLLPSDDSFQDEMDVKRAWAAAAEALADEAAGEGGTAAAARAALHALPAVRAAPRAALLELLHGERDAGRLRALLRLLALAAAPAAHAAAAAFLQLRDPDPLADLARSYLAALAHADRPHEEVVLDVLRLGGADALLAAAAAAPRASAAAARAVRDALLRGLAACKKEECYVSRLEALGNLRRADTADALLAHAAAAQPGVSLAALRALRALPAAALRRAARLDRLEALACNARSFDVRGAALDLLVARAAAAPLRLERVAHALHARGHPELRRLLWQRLRALAPRSARVRQLLALLPPRLSGWHAQAIAGTSSVLERELRAAGGAGGAGGRRARLESVQLARGGLLRAGRVALLAGPAADAAPDTPDADEDEPISVELWTRGLEALSGGAGEGAAEAEGDGEGAEDAAGGLLLAVSGARLPAITLFSGQAELLGHVWAGRGSEPTGVVRAVRPLPSRAGLTPLCAGALLRWRQRAALALALDAQAQASLWSRSARAQLELRAALAAELSARVASASAALGAAAELSAEPRLRIAADLDFYDGVALCVRVESAPHEVAQALRLNATLGAPPGRERRVRRATQRAWAAPGRTLALGAPNDAACRTLGSSLA